MASRRCSSTDQLESASNAGCFYVHVGKGANDDEMAVDIRNQAVTVIWVCCCSEEMAARMKTALSKGAVNKTRGHGGGGRDKSNSRALARRNARCSSIASWRTSS